MLLLIGSFRDTSEKIKLQRDFLLIYKVNYRKKRISVNQMIRIGKWEDYVDSKGLEGLRSS